MKKNIITAVILIATLFTKVNAQEKFGKTLNIGAGIGYYGFYNGNRNIVGPGINLNYEFDVANNLTLAPFLSATSVLGRRDWQGTSYSYKQTNIPIGIKGTYYFDKILNANDKWDFYLGASAGFVYRNTAWESGYFGDKNYYYSTSLPLYADLHIGTELHLNSKVGLMLDLSTGMSTFGLGLHF